MPRFFKGKKDKGDKPQVVVCTTPAAEAVEEQLAEQQRLLSFKKSQEIRGFIAEHQGIEGDEEELENLHENFLVNFPGYKDKIERLPGYSEENTPSPSLVYIAIHQVVRDIIFDRHHDHADRRFSDEEVVTVYELLTYGKKLEGRERFRHNYLERNNLARDTKENYQLAFGDQYGQGKLVSLVASLQERVSSYVPEQKYFESYRGQSLKDECKERLQDDYVPAFESGDQILFLAALDYLIERDTIRSNFREVDISTGEVRRVPFPDFLEEEDIFDSCFYEVDVDTGRANKIPFPTPLRFAKPNDSSVWSPVVAGGFGSNDALNTAFYTAVEELDRDSLVSLRQRVRQKIASVEELVGKFGVTLYVNEAGYKQLTELDSKSEQKESVADREIPDVVAIDASGEEIRLSAKQRKEVKAAIKSSPSYDMVFGFPDKKGLYALSSRLFVKEVVNTSIVTDLDLVAQARACLEHSPEGKQTVRKQSDSGDSGVDSPFSPPSDRVLPVFNNADAVPAVVRKRAVDRQAGKRVAGDWSAVSPTRAVDRQTEKRGAGNWSDEEHIRFLSKSCPSWMV